jgi:hypothetical protein
LKILNLFKKIENFSSGFRVFPKGPMASAREETCVYVSSAKADIGSRNTWLLKNSKSFNLPMLNQKTGQAYKL